jgi:cyclic pyranopterin phosphate synthase
MGLKMVDITERSTVKRKATAKGRIYLFAETIDAVKNSRVERGEVLAAAQIAGIHGVKATCDLIPMCQTIPLTRSDIQFRFKRDHIECICEVQADYKTGVEMEALVGVTTALLTIWDMVKYMEKDEDRNYNGTKISDIEVEVEIARNEQ